jgi:hypothetical protein
MKTNQTIKSYLKTKWVSISFMLFILVFFTCGFPTNADSNDWQLYSIHDMTPKWKRVIAAIFSAIVLFGLAAQMLNEYKKGGRNDGNN